VVFAATAGDVRHVIVGGRVVVADGMHLTVEVGAELDFSIKQVWS
jgi:cytosine/adenosine deaminase-related metal-dependent hydrolase